MPDCRKDGRTMEVRALDLSQRIFGQGVARDSLSQVTGEIAVALGWSTASVQVTEGEYPSGLLAYMATCEAKPVARRRCNAAFSSA